MLETLTSDLGGHADLELLLITHLPGPVGWEKRFLYWRSRLKSLGAGVRIDPGVYFQRPDMISIGEGSWIDRDVIIMAGLDESTRERTRLPNEAYRGRPGEVTIGRHVHIGPRCIISGIAGGAEIGDDCGFSAGVCVYALSHQYRRHGGARAVFSPMVPMEAQYLLEGPVVIGSNTGIALNGVVLPGTTVPVDCFVAINAVVAAGQYPANSVLAGHPATVRGRRFLLP